ncbi:hypothetical protein [Erythrobacter sp. R86502]|uniref:hypothetical protein n=1 Tax=Erythrobacter sp. R86502 TaxID=3093846 RepID=UPI0036D38186
MERMEATTFELWSWRISEAVRFVFIYLIAWPVFIASIPATIYMGVTIAGDILSGIRDWWHYKEVLPSENRWMGLAIIVTGLIWVVGMGVADSPPGKDNTTRFNEFIRSSRSSQEYADKQREIEKTRDKTRWDKFKDFITLTYGVLMLAMLAALGLKELFF